MSRNVKSRPQATPARPTRQRALSPSPSPDLSDDGGYSGVDDVSDSEDDDQERVDAAEAEHIIKNTSSPQPLRSDDEDDADEEDELDEDDDDVDEDESTLAGEEAAETGSWEGIATDTEANAETSYVGGRITGVRRQVRFAGVPDSDSESTTTDATDDMDKYFPDIFVEETALHPSFRREIERDIDDLSSTESFWDVPGGSPTEMGGVALPASEGSSICDDESTHGVVQSEDLDGYDSGDTTADEEPPLPRPRRSQLRSGRIRTSGDSSDSDTDRPFPRGRSRGSRFDLDDPDDKPIAIMHPVTRKLIIFTPKKARRLDQSPESFHEDMSLSIGPWQDGLDSSPTAGQQPLLFTAMWATNTFADVMRDSDFRLEEALLPSIDFGMDASPGNESDLSGMLEDMSSGSEEGAAFDAFVHWGDDSSDESVNGDIDSPSTPSRRPSMTTDAESDTQMETGVLTHLTHPDAVASFRRNQDTERLILSQAETRDSISLSEPHLNGTLKGVKSGHLERANVPLTPSRRRKSTDQANILESPSQKRKASDVGTGGSHKRYRSISDVRDIAL